MNDQILVSKAARAISDGCDGNIVQSDGIVNAAPIDSKTEELSTFLKIQL